MRDHHVERSFCQQKRFDFVHNLDHAPKHADLPVFIVTPCDPTMKPHFTKTNLPASLSGGHGADEVFLRIYEAVVDHRLPPGTKLREQPLAELFGVTRGTIRKAFNQLANRKVIDLTPNRGASVASPSIEQSRDLFAARGTIEGAIVDLLARRITKVQVRELNAMVQLETRAYVLGDTRGALKLSVDFHRVLAKMAGNEVFIDMLDQLVSRTPLVVLAYRNPAHPAACANSDHIEIVAALAAKDADGAVRNMKCHLCNLEGQLKLRRYAPVNQLAAIFETQNQASNADSEG